jgi:PAS domain-containing protein
MRIDFQKSFLAAGVRMLRVAWRQIENVFGQQFPSDNGKLEFHGIRDALDKSPQPIAFSDSLGSFRYGNLAFEELFAYKRHQIYRRWLFEFLAHPEQSGEILSTLRG